MKKINDGLTRKQRYYLRHPEKANEWAKNNRERINKRRKENYNKNPEIKKKLDEYRKTHREQYRRYARNRIKTPDEIVKDKKDYLNHYQKIVQLKKEKGNKCQLCGYDKEPKILHFHHIKEKKFTISSSRRKPIEELREEANKCILICPNCHAELHLIDRPYKGKYKTNESI